MLLFVLLFAMVAAVAVAVAKALPENSLAVSVCVVIKDAKIALKVPPEPESSWAYPVTRGQMATFWGSSVASYLKGN